MAPSQRCAVRWLGNCLCSIFYSFRRFRFPFEDEQSRPVDKCAVIVQGYPPDIFHERLIHHLERRHFPCVSVANALRERLVPAFLWAEMEGVTFSKDLFHLKCGMKNIISDSKNVVCDKSNLFSNMRQHHPDIAEKHMALTISLTSKDGTLSLPEQIPAGVSIIRPVDGCFGRGLSVLENPTRDQLVAAVSKAQHDAKEVKRFKISEVLLSKYCEHVRLWTGKKFHLRTFLIVASYGTAFQTFAFPQSIIYTTKEPYVAGDYENLAKHDSHTRAENDPLFPRDAAAENFSSEEQQSITIQMHSVLRAVSSLLAPHSKPYSESRYCFEVFGVDFLIAADNTPILLEVNDKTAYRFLSEEKLKLFSEEFYDFLDEALLVPLLDGKPATVQPLFSAPS